MTEAHLGSATAGGSGFTDVLGVVDRIARDTCPDHACPTGPTLDQGVHFAATSCWQSSRIPDSVPV